MSIRSAFVARFGEEQAQSFELAANQHVASENKGGDPFKWTLLVCIGWQCAEIAEYRQHHGITVPYQDLADWIKAHANLGTHDGDCDLIAAMAGKYGDLMRPATGRP